MFIARDVKVPLESRRDCMFIARDVKVPLESRRDCMFIAANKVMNFLLIPKGLYVDIQ